MTIKKAIFLLISAILCLPALAAGADSTSTATGYHRYIPHFHGTVRVFFEQSTVENDARFAVRNARLSAGGYVLPMVDYLLQVDFCDRGKIKMLDAYVSLRPVSGLRLMAGQMRVPFGIDASRSPHAYFFMNRSFPGKSQGNLRSVGVKAGYTLPRFPLYVEAGVFNATDRGDHSQWNRRFTYGAKVRWDAPAGFTPQVAFMSRAHADTPGARRLTLYDASLSWHNSQWWIEAEYERTNVRGHDGCNAFNIMARYGFDTNFRWMNRLSFEARFDGTGELTDGTPSVDDPSRLTIVSPERKRLTLGTTATYRRDKLFLDFRINYEQYFYDGNAPSGPDGNNRLGCALILHF